MVLFIIGRLVGGKPAPVIETDDPAVAQARSAVINLMVRDSQAPGPRSRRSGKPAILMVNSKTCSFCRQSLKDIAALQGTDALPMLRIAPMGLMY